MKVLSIRLPSWMLNLLDDLVMKGIFVSRSEAIRYGVRLVLKMYEKELKQDRSKDYYIMRRLERKIEEIKDEEDYWGE